MKMELTAKILRDWFGCFNTKYFNGELPEPRLLVSSARTQLGQFSCRRVRKGLFRGYATTDFTIKVSDYYDMSEQEYQQTLLHEMIHYYITYTGARDTSAHGRLFRQLAEKINKTGGWHITISSKTDQYAVRNQKTGALYLLIVIETTDHCYFLSVVNPSYRNYVNQQALCSTMVLAHFFLVSNDSKYATWPKSRSLRGRRISEEEYRKMMILVK